MRMDGIRQASAQTRSDWKHGRFGTKIQKAIDCKRRITNEDYKRAGGERILIVHEERWAAL